MLRRDLLAGLAIPCIDPSPGPADLAIGAEERFLMSLNDRPEVREMFGWASVEAVETN